MKNDKRIRGGVYVHVPFCRGRCTYCSFYSIGSIKNADWNAYVDSIIGEFRDRMTEMDGWQDVTIYIGGGTPSLMPVSAFEKMLSGLRDIIRERCGENVCFLETTIEANPDDVDEEKVKGWKAAGVDRVSMGVQSMEDEELKVIGRRHNSAQVREAYNILRREFDNVSLDLIFGLPGQTVESLCKTLDIFKEMVPEHISAYSLMYEERSVLLKQLDRGEIEETPEDISVEMFKLINSKLREAGYERYEISNYALQGRRSKHNSSYWEGIPYIGLGPSAHSYDGHNIRKWNSPHYVRTTIENGEAENLTTIERGDAEYLSEDELREERIMTRLRVKEGLDLKDFKEEFGDKAYRDIIKRSKRYLESGELELCDNHLMLTESGVMISDEIISSLF